MKRKSIFTVLSFTIFVMMLTLSFNKAVAKTDSISESKLGAIVLGYPLGCDCTVPGTACYCIMDDPSSDPGDDGR